jgi:predicted ATPase
MTRAFDTRPVAAIEFHDDPEQPVDRSAWPFTMPAVRQLVDDGFDVGDVTVLVGENGSGKSTLVEAIAMAYGFAPEGGSNQARHTTRSSESDLYRALRIRRGIGASQWGFFLRAETMHGFSSYLEANPGGRDPVFHEMSHGESFLAVLGSRFNSPGFYVLDEPESALSFSGCLALVGAIHDLVAQGAQALIATHSPVVASVPGARILEVGEWGLRETAWEDLDLVQNWRLFLDAPQRYLRHVID